MPVKDIFRVQEAPTIITLYLSRYLCLGLYGGFNSGKSMWNEVTVTSLLHVE